MSDYLTHIHSILSTNLSELDEPLNNRDKMAPKSHLTLSPIHTRELFQLVFCPQCNKPYKKKGRWFDRHVEICKGKNFTTKLLNNQVSSITTALERCQNPKLTQKDFPFNFEDDLFQDNSNEKSINEPDSQEFSLSNAVEAAMTPNMFHILHLNINSAFSKMEHFIDVLNCLNVDIITLSETKLDDQTPDRFFEHSNYNIIRRNRNNRGGGILVLIKKCSGFRSDCQH